MATGRAAAFLALVLLAPGPAHAESWRTGAFDTGITSFVSVQVSEGTFASAVYLGFSCVARPLVRLRVPIVGARPNATPMSLSVAFEAADELTVISLTATLAPIAAARAPDNWSATTDPDRAELIAERVLSEPEDRADIIALARFLGSAGEGVLTVRGAGPRFSVELPLDGAPRAMNRFLTACRRALAP